MDVLTEDTGRSRTVKVKAKGSIGCSFMATIGQNANTIGRTTYVTIGDWDLSFTPSFIGDENAPYLAVAVTGSNIVTDENFVTYPETSYKIQISDLLVDQYIIPQTYGNFSFQYEAELITTNLHEVVSIEMHNEEEYYPYPSNNKYASWGYPQFGYIVPFEDEQQSPHFWTNVSAYKGGMTSGTEMTIGKYYERYSKSGESDSMTTLNLTVSSTNNWGKGSETITFGPSAAIVQYEGEKFTGYTYDIRAISTDERFAGAEPLTTFTEESWFEATFEANNVWYPYDIGDFTRVAYEGDTPYYHGTNWGDARYLLGTCSSSGNKIRLKAGEENETGGYSYTVGVDLAIIPSGRVSVKGKVLQPDGSDWDGSCKLQALWKGVQVDQTTHLAKWQEEGSHIDTDTDGVLDENYGISSIKGDITWSWWTYYSTKEKIDIEERFLAIMHEQRDLTNKHQYYESWRIQLQDPWVTYPYSVVHPLEATVDDFQEEDLWEGVHTFFLWENGVMTVNVLDTDSSIHTAYPPDADCGFDSNDVPYLQALRYQWKAWRYAKFKLKSDMAFVMTIKSAYRVKRVPVPDYELVDHYDHYYKEWDVNILGDNAYHEYVIDLCAPDRFSGDKLEYDVSDWVADLTEEDLAFANTQQITPIRKELKHNPDFDPPLIADDVMPFVPHALVGVGHQTRLSLYGMPIYAHLLFDKISVCLEPDLTGTHSEALLTVSPVWQNSEIWKLTEEEEDHIDIERYHPEGKRIVSGLSNFKSSIDIPYATRGGMYKGTSFPTITDAFNLTMTGTPVCGLTLSAGYQPEPEYPHHVRGNDHYLAAWLSPILWDIPEHGDIKLFDYKIKPEVPNVDTLQLEARAACDIWVCYPGIGDPNPGGSGYGQTFPLHFVSVQGAICQGITYDKITRKPISDSNVQVWQNSDSIGTLVKVGNFKSNLHHFWRSTTLRTDHLYEPNTALAYFRNSALTSDVKSYMLSKRQHWASLIGNIPNDGVGLSYDISNARRHYRAYVKGGTIWVGVASNTLPIKFNDYDTTIEANSAKIVLNKFQILEEIYLVYIHDLKVYSTKTTTGNVWSTPMEISITGTKATVETAKDGRLFYYWIEKIIPEEGHENDPEDFCIKGKIYNSLNTIIKDTFIVIANGVLDDSIDAAETVTGQGVWKMVITYNLVDKIITETSGDGFTFTD